MARSYPYPPDTRVKWVSTEWLDSHLDDNMTIVDCQPNIHDYVQEHIPGAVYLNEEFLRTSKNGMPNIFSGKEVAETTFRRVGVSMKRPVLVYTGTGLFKKWGDGLEQTMMAYGLSRWGHDNVIILDGGLDKWRKEGRKVTQVFPKKEEGDFRASLHPEYYVEYKRFLEIKDRPDVLVLDARPPAFYEGQGPWIKPGHIPGAISFPWANLMTDNKRELKPEEEITSMLKAAGISKDKTVITSCGTGREQTNEFLLLKFWFGYPNVLGHEGAFTEWTAYPDNPTVVGKSPR